MTTIDIGKQYEESKKLEQFKGIDFIPMEDLKQQKLQIIDVVIEESKNEQKYSEENKKYVMFSFEKENGEKGYTTTHAIRLVRGFEYALKEYDLKKDKLVVCFDKVMMDAKTKRQAWTFI